MNIISKTLVQDAVREGAALVLEDLTGIRQSLNQKPRSKTERRRTNHWAFYQLRQFVQYKANLAGVTVVFVSPAYTSQTCHRCWHIHPEPGKSYRNGEHFRCEGDADDNASMVIASLGATVNSPKVPFAPAGRRPQLGCSLADKNWDKARTLALAKPAGGTAERWVVYKSSLTLKSS